MSMTPERRITIAKDLILFLIGIGGIGYQQVTGKFNLALALIYALATGIPGVTNLFALFRPVSTDTVSLPSSCRSEQPPTSQEASSSTQ